jgi:hypothetical protein
VSLLLGAVLASNRMLRVESRATREDLDAIIRRQNHLESEQRGLVQKVDEAALANQTTAIMAEAAVHTAQRAEEKALAREPAAPDPSSTSSGETPRGPRARPG